MTVRDEAIEAAARRIGEVICGHAEAIMTCTCLRCDAQAALAAAVPVLLNDLADRIAKLAPYNCELRYDGSEDPHAAAWVEGIRDAHTLVVRAAAEGWGA